MKIKAHSQFIKTFSVLILLLLSFVSGSLKAGDIKLVSRLDRAAIAAGREITVVDPRRNDPNSGGTNYFQKHTNTVALVYGREALSDIIILPVASWSFTVNYNVVDIGNNNATIANRNLVISNSTAIDGVGDYEALDIHEALSGNVKIVILSISSTGTVPTDLRMELRMNVNRYDNLATSTTVQNLKMFFNSTNYENTIVWEAVQGAEEYELEWAYWDNKNTNLTPSSEELWSTATRIRLRDNYYIMNMIFPEGKVTYRVRPVGRHFQNVNGDYTHIQYGTWTTPNASSEIIFSTTSSGSNIFTPFESTKHWGYEITFAEDGLRKQVIAYVDNSLTPRQVLTDLSTEDLVIVGEPLYDVEGRGTASLMPAPLGGTNNNLFYKPNLNKAVGGTTYGRNNFDKPSGADQLGASSGTGQYYSTSNPLSNTFMRDYIPSAEGYPIAQVRFKNDATGRPIEASGVGALHKMGSTMQGAHTSKYYYANPTNSQLRRLFGINVGDAKYYEKNIAIDANGQMSASYVDGAGRTVATSLIGGTPGNLLPVSDTAVNTKTFREVLLSAQDEEPQRLYTFNYFNEASQNAVEFNYTLAGLDNLLYAGSPINICYDCRYELEFSIEAPDGSAVDLKNFAAINGDVNLSAQLPITSTADKLLFTIEPILPCADNLPYNAGTVSFKADFPNIGTYIIRKKLRVLSPNHEGLRLLAEQTVLNNLGFNDAQAFIDDYVDDNTDPSACSNCSPDICANLVLEHLGPAPDPNAPDGQWLFNQYIVRYNAQYNACVAGTPGSSCADLQQEIAVTNAAEAACGAMLEKMKADFSPGGCIYDKELTTDYFVQSAYLKINPLTTYSILDGFNLTVLYPTVFKNIIKRWIALSIVAKIMVSIPFFSASLMKFNPRLKTLY